MPNAEDEFKKDYGDQLAVLLKPLGADGMLAALVATHLANTKVRIAGPDVALCGQILLVASDIRGLAAVMKQADLGRDVYLSHEKQAFILALIDDIVKATASWRN